jgi:predicted small lipoprotein YifL
MKNKIVSLYQKTFPVFLLVIALTACGKKGPLVFTPKPEPMPIKIIELYQKGDAVKVKWEFPTILSDEKTSADLSIIENIQIFHSQDEIPYEKFKKKAFMAAKLQPKDLKKESNWFFSEISFKTSQLKKTRHFFSILYHYGKKQAPLSEIMTLQTELPPVPISTLKAIQENKVIKLRWEAPTQDIKKKPLIVNGYRLYKKISTESVSKETELPVTDFMVVSDQPIMEEFYEDFDTGKDGTYHYYVTSLLSPQIESAPSSMVSISITDIYPPEIPGNLICFKASDHIYLSWKRVTDKDFSFFNLYRQDSTSQQFQLLKTSLVENAFEDKSVSRGITYRYYVTAVDQKGNESDASNTVQELF